MDQCTAPVLPISPGTDFSATAEETNDVLLSITKQLFPKRGIQNYNDVVTAFKSIVMSLGWLSNINDPMLRQVVSNLGSVMATPSVAAFKALKQVMRYVKGLLGYGYTFYANDPHAKLTAAFEATSDASFNDCPGSKSRFGYELHFPGQASFCAAPKQTATICTYTFQAETHAASECCKEVIHFRTIQTELGMHPTAPTLLFVDNIAAVLI